jgi:hypothetical protein
MNNEDTDKKEGCAACPNQANCINFQESKRLLEALQLREQDKPAPNYESNINRDPSES